MPPRVTKYEVGNNGQSGIADWLFFHYGVNDSHMIARADSAEEKYCSIPS